MSEETSIEFVIHGKLEGRDITPSTIGLSQFNEFNQQVEAFIGGSEKLKLDQVHVEIAPSSYVLRTLLPVVIFAALEQDLKLLARQDVLGELDIKRAEVVQKCQARAKTNPDYQPAYNEEALDRFTAKGSAAWAEVPDATQWVREMRGG